jgi:hypothetical protein
VDLAGSQNKHTFGYSGERDTRPQQANRLTYLSRVRAVALSASGKREHASKI